MVWGLEDCSEDGPGGLHGKEDVQCLQSECCWMGMWGFFSTHPARAEGTDAGRKPGAGLERLSWKKGSRESNEKRTE